MADKKISQLTPATLPLAGTELLPIVQSGTTDNITVNNLAAGNVKSNATTGVLQVVGPAASSTRVMTTPDANFTVARTDTGQTFTGTQTFSSDLVVNGIAVGKGANSVFTNTAVGLDALVSNTTGSLNTGVGRTSLTSNTIGLENTGVGANTLQTNLSGSYNFAGGTYSLVLNSTGSGNTGVGHNSLRSTTNSYNTACGFYAGYNLTSGSNCAFFGYNAQPSSATVSNEYTYGDANVTAHRFYGNLTPLGSAKGINFTANTPAAGMTSQLLNWYEEGTFTPAMSSGSGGPITLSVATGQYTRIGNLITFRLRVTVSNANSAGGAINVTGLPFTCSSTITCRNRVIAADISNVTGSTMDSIGGTYVPNGTTNISILTSTFGNITLTNTSSMDLTGTYFC